MSFFVAFIIAVSALNLAPYFFASSLDSKVVFLRSLLNYSCENFSPYNMAILVRAKIDKNNFFMILSILKKLSRYHSFTGMALLLSLL